MKYGLHPKSFNIGGTEKYYAQMAQKGFSLVKRGSVFSHFEKSEPQDMKYRIEISSPDSSSERGLPDEQIGVYEDCGWEYVCSSGCLHIFRAPAESEAPEFYLSPEMQADTLKSLKKEYISSALRPFLSLALFSVFAAFLWGSTGESFTAKFYEIWVSDTYLILGLLLLLAGIISSDVQGIFYISRLYKKMKSGIGIDHESRSENTLSRIVTAIIILAAAGLILYDYTASKPQILPSEPQKNYIILSEMGIDGERIPNSINGKESGLVYTDTPIAETYRTSEFKGDETHNEWLYQKVFIFKSGNVPEGFTEALIKNSVFGEKGSSLSPVEIEGLDMAWTAKNTEIIAVCGNRVIAINHFWKNDSDMQDTLRLISEKWN